MRKIEIKSNLPDTFIRTLTDDQELCPECGGIQLVFDGKYINGCKSCLGMKGVVSKCQYCGELALYMHGCDESKKIAAQKKADIALDKWNKLKKITLDEAAKQFDMLYVSDTEDYVEPDCLADWCEDNEISEELKGFKIYGTYKTKINFDAYRIIENACDDLHEDAGDCIETKAIDELQKYLDSWSEKYGQRTATYNPDTSIGIII